MVTINGIVNTFFSVICTALFIIVLMSPVIIAAIWGTRAGLRNAKQINQNIAEGVYQKWDKAKTSRLRTMIITQMILLVSGFVWIATGFIKPSETLSPFQLTILAFILIVMFVLGFAITKMIVKNK